MAPSAAVVWVVLELGAWGGRGGDVWVTAAGHPDPCEGMGHPNTLQAP